MRTVSVDDIFSIQIASVGREYFEINTDLVAIDSSIILGKKDKFEIGL